MDSSRLKWLLLGISLALLITASTFASGLAIGYFAGELDPNDGLVRTVNDLFPQISFGDSSEYTTQPPPESSDFFAPFYQAWDIVHQDYVDQPLDDVALLRGAIQGAIDAIGDPQTSYMDPDTYLQANIPLEGSYEGIGAWVDTEGDYLTIISPMPGSPAEAAGLEPGDVVVAIDGEDVTGIDPSLVVRRVLGPAGSLVTLTIRRGESMLEFEIERGSIQVPSVQFEILENGIGYIQLFSFSNDTTEDLRTAIRSLKNDGASAMILDLRGNGGGFLFSAIDVSSEFIAEGLILTERFGDGSQQIYEASGRGLATDLPLIVLINAGSASASEIVAGAIQDYGRGLLVGETSFGKGSVQNWIPLDDEQGAVRVTIARWYTPNDTLIDDQGLTPDYVVEFNEEHFSAGVDPQLEKAIELLTAKETTANLLLGLAGEG